MDLFGSFQSLGIETGTLTMFILLLVLATVALMDRASRAIRLGLIRGAGP